MSNYKSILQSNNTALSSNNLDLQSLIDQANALPDAVNIDAELSTQDDLISQIQAAVDSLPEAGSGGSSGDDSIETCTVEVSTNINSPVIYSTIDESGKITMTWTNDYSNTHLLTVICGSYIFIPVVSTIPAYNINGGAEFIETLSGYSSHRTMVFKINGTASINCYDND